MRSFMRRVSSASILATAAAETGRERAAVSPWRAKRVCDQRRCLIARIVGAVAKMQTPALQPPRGRASTAASGRGVRCAL